MMNSNRYNASNRSSAWLACLVVVLAASAADGTDVHFDLTARMNGQAVMSDGTVIATCGAWPALVCN